MSGGTSNVLYGAYEQVEMLRRQYLQLLEPDQLSIPCSEMIRKPEVQARIYQSMFQENGFPYQPPESYRVRVLKLLVDHMEKALIDPDEDVRSPYCRFHP